MTLLDVDMAWFVRELVAATAEAAGGLLAAHPVPCVAAACAALLWLTRAWWWPRTPTDPRRMFTAAERQRAKQFAGGRCEMDTWLRRRCRRPGEHADHWIPWSRGGATTSRNLVWACAKHNLRKSSRMPTRWQTARITRRRAAYFPAGADRVPGDRFRPALDVTEMTRV